MHYRWQAISHHGCRTVVLLSVTLLLVWNFATIAHQLDLVPEHHDHHHCQMFSGAHHGLIKAPLGLLAPTYQRSTYSDVIKKHLNVSDVRYTARAPPVFA